MKTARKIIRTLSVVAAAVMIVSAVIPASAVTVPVLAVTSNEYGHYSRIVPDEIREIDAGETLQLYAIVKFGNEMGETPEENGWFVETVLTEGVSWKSADGSVATVDGNGLVTGIGAGRTKITATYDERLYDGGPASYYLDNYEASFEITVMENGLPFSDVEKNAWYYENVKFVREKGLMDGVSGRKFSPDGTLTRAMTATVIWRLLGKPEGTDTKQFRDVPDGAWYADAVRWARSQAIVQGVGNDRFDPNGKITRAMFAVMIHRLGDSLGVIWAESDEIGDPTDIDSVPGYAKAAVTELFRAGIVQGKGGGVFDPMAAITRAECAALLERTVIAFAIPDTDPSGTVIRCGYSGGGNSIAVLHSKDQVEQFIASHPQNFGNDYGGSAAANALREFSSRFFAGNTLAVGFVTASSGSVQFSLGYVVAADSTFYVGVQSKGLGPGEAGTCDMATWCVIAPIPKKDVLSYNIVLTVNGRKITEPGSVGTVLGYRYSIDAWVDKMPALGGKKLPNFSVTVVREDKTGEPVGDVSIKLLVGDEIVDLVRDGNPDRADSCTFRARTDDPDFFGSFYLRSGIKGELLFKFGGDTELVPFYVSVREMDYM